MDDLQSSDEGAFENEEIETIVMKVVEEHLAEQPYDEKKVPGWISAICEDTMRDISELGKPFKYIVSCVIMQDVGSGMHTAHSSFCDGINDGVVTVKWPPEKTKDQNTICCFVTVFGMALFSK